MFTQVLYNVYMHLQLHPRPLFFLLKVILKVRITKISNNSENLKRMSTVSWTDNKCYLQSLPLCCRQNRNSSYVASLIWWLFLLAQYAHLICNIDCAILAFVTWVLLYNVVFTGFLYFLIYLNALYISSKLFRKIKACLWFFPFYGALTLTQYMEPWWWLQMLANNYIFARFI